MKIIIAGATGAIGNPLIRFLMKIEFDIFGITHSEERGFELKQLGVNPVILDVLDKQAVFSAFERIRPEIVIDMLTRLPKEYTPEAMRKSAPNDAKIRWDGGASLLEASLKFRSKRYIVQSCGFWYEQGKGLADETVSLAFQASPGVSAGARLYQDIENRLFNSKLEGVALRFGFFYGPGTWFNSDGNVAEQIKARRFPVIGKGEGVWSFVHIDDAASAVVAAIESDAGVYNVVNDQPSKIRDWLPAFAKYLGAEAPPHISEEKGLLERGADSVYYSTRLRGASNIKAKNKLHFQPRVVEWF